MRVEQQKGEANGPCPKRSFGKLLPQAEPNRPTRQAPSPAPKDRLRRTAGSPALPALPAQKASAERAKRQLLGSQRFESRLWEALTRSAENARGREQARRDDRQRDFALGWAPEARAEGRSGTVDGFPETEARPTVQPWTTPAGATPPPEPGHERPADATLSGGHVREIRALVERAELFLRDGAPTLRLTLDGRALTSAVELTRGPDKTVSVRLQAKSMSPGEARAAAAQIREALRERGLGVGCVQVLSS